MKLTGTFSTPASVAQLRRLFGSAADLTQVPTLQDVVRVDATTLRMVYSPFLGLGPVPLDTTVTTVRDTDDVVQLVVSGKRGTQAVDVVLDVYLNGNGAGAGTEVSWQADVVVRGSIASVGQRVIGDLASRAIGDVLAASAQVSTGVSA